MPVDFTQIADGEKFELLCEDLLRALGFAIKAEVARGPDLGKDIIATKTTTDELGFSREHHFLVECKHYAKSGNSVREPDIGNPIARMGTHDCDRYILATSTVASEKVRKQLEGIPNTVPQYQAAIWHAAHLARLLDAHPDVRARHFPSEPEPEPTPAGVLAATVEGLLEVMGFGCQGREHARDQVQLICTSKGALARPLAVVCKEGTVQKGDVEAVLTQVREDDLGGGDLVTHTRVSPAARDAAAATGGLMRAFTLDEFYRELIDFEPYVQSLIADYDGSELATYYVDLGCRTADGSEIKPMDDYVDDWLRDPTRNHISILGDYGTGKTSFCRQYAAELGRRWLADPDRNRIPILITLRDYAKAMKLQQLVTDFLVNRCDIQAKYEGFRRFNADGKLVLLFDGFDEMAEKVDYDRTTLSNFDQLAGAVEGRSKVLLTCRTHYFRTRKDAERFLHTPYAHFPSEDGGTERGAEARETGRGPLIDLTDRPNFEIVHLLPFDDADVQAILQKRAPDQWEDNWQQIQDTYNLPELAQRPVLLDMIVCSLPKLEPGQAINAARLYEVYTGLWLTRDWEKGRTLITRDNKRVFMQQLALEMHRRGDLSIHYSRLPEHVQAHFKLDKATELDYFEHDVRTCSFLNRDSDGNYQFVHKSFGEFFVAQWLAPRLLDATAPEMPINEEIRGFVRGLLEDAPWPPPPPEGVEVPKGMVWVPEGPFIMGDESYGEGGTRVVRLEHGFFIARTPVTNAEYARFVKATRHELPHHWRGQVPPEILRDHPVVYVNCEDAGAYCRWLTRQLQASGAGAAETLAARLPASEEWEKAARGIDGRIFPWGDGFYRARCNSRESGIGTSTPVGRYSPTLCREVVEGGDSPCGCADVAGNVREWTGAESGISTDVISFRAVRGGAFHDGERYVRCAYRNWDLPNYRNWNRGFRLCVVSQRD